MTLSGQRTSELAWGKRDNSIREMIKIDSVPLLRDDLLRAVVHSFRLLMILRLRNLLRFVIAELSNLLQY